ncbi:amidase [Oxalobacteraceae bacterium A2-2]
MMQAMRGADRDHDLPRDFPINDTVGAWVPHGRFVQRGAGTGPLAGLAFAAKDVFDVAGHVTGAGNPCWLATHEAAAATAPLVQRLLDAGATLVGKTLTDELAYSVHGDNMHYGTPLNVRAPGRVPGGSSSGSAAAVAAGLCDFALATDTGGSTRVPASYCGLWGLRTTHGLLPRAGMVPLHPGFDTPTWLADDAGVFQRVGQVLLPAWHGPRLGRVLMLDDLLAQADPAFHAAAERVYAKLAEGMSVRRTQVTGASAGGGSEHAGAILESWRKAYVTASAREGWLAHGEWITATQPRFGAAIAGRWDMARATSETDAIEARALQAEVRAAVRELLGEDGIAVLPSAASIAPRLDASEAEIDRIRARTFRITCVAGLAGLPQVSIPLRSPEGLPIGISLLGPAGSDLALIAVAAKLAAELAAPL